MATWNFRFLSNGLELANFQPVLYINNVAYEANTKISTDPITTDTIFKIICKDGYSLNPNNETPPIINNVSGIMGVAQYGVGTTSYAYNSYTISDDYKELTFTLTSSAVTAIKYYNPGGTYTYTTLLPIRYTEYLQATAETVTKEYTITQNLTGVSTDITATTITEGESLTGTFTLNNGYENLSYSVIMGDTTITGTTNTFTIDSVTDNVIINATATKINYTISAYLTKCEITDGNIPQTATYGENIFFECKAISGYTAIRSAYYIKNGTKYDITINSSGYVSTIITITANTDIYISAIETYTITENLTNVISAESNVKTIAENETFLLQYTPETGYLIETITSNIGTVTISNDKTYATISGIATENINIVGTANKIYKVSITGTIENATCNYTDGEIIDLEKPLIITANENYEFTGAYTYIKGVVTFDISKSADNTYLQCNFEDGYNYIFNDNYTATTKVEKISTFCNLYNVTNDELNSLSKKRFVTTDTETMDYGTFITQLYIMPIEIPTYFKGEKGNIILGNYDSNVESTLLRSYILEFSGGVITVPEKYNNVYDYINTICTLRLPFFNPIILDTEYVIGQTITLYYSIDLYSGNLTVNIYSTFTDGCIESQTINFVTQIPFIQKQNNSIVNQLSNVQKSLFDTAQIEIVRNIPYFSNNIYGKETIDFDYINTVNGYCEISDIDLRTTATNDEKTEIESLLKQGVFINGI